MKRLFTALLLITLSACSQKKPEMGLERKDILINKVKQEENKIQNQNLSDLPGASMDVKPKLPVSQLYPEHVVVLARDVNLDIDTEEEHIILLKDSEARIRLVVADFNKSNRVYFAAWEADLSILHSDTLAFYEEDITGDQELELVCMGQNSEGKNTLYAFKKTNPPRGLHVYYKNIFSYESEGTVEIKRVQRIQAYDQGQTTGVPFDIEVEEPEQNLQESLNLKKLTYKWHRYKKNYQIHEITRSTQDKDIKEKLREIYRGNTTNFKNSVAREWYKVTKNNTIEEVIIFDDKNETIQFYRDNGISNFHWVKTYRQLYKSIRLQGRNHEISNMYRWITVTMNGLNEIQVSVSDDSSWNGKYFPLSGSIKQEMLPKHHTRLERPSLVTGIYKNINFNASFEYPDFTFQYLNEEKIEKGKFSLVTQPDTGYYILQMKVLNENGMIIDTRNYRMEYSEEKDDTRIIRALSLTRGILTTDDITIHEDSEKLRLEQTEVIDNRES